MNNGGLIGSVGRRRNALRLAAAIVAVSAALGIGGYLGRVSADQARMDQDVETICIRQDAVISVLTYIVSPERQGTLNRQGPPAAIAKTDRALRALVAAIDASPCGSHELRGGR